jgi:hypothetical protein
VILLQEQNPRGWEWRSLTAGGFVGLIIVLLTNILPIFASLTDIFAAINILLLVCALFSPLLLIYCFLDGTNLSKAIAIASYISSAFLTGFIIANLARGDKYYSGLIVISDENSWSIATLISIILLIPIINIFASIPIAAWLGSLIYCKVYMASLFYRALIGSPLFAIPIFVALGCEISRTAISRMSIVYIFDKTSGALTRQRPPKVKAPVKKMLATIIVFLTLSLMVSAVFGVWNELEEAIVSRISDFHLSAYSYYYDSYNCYLEVSFSLVNVRGKSITSAGEAELLIFNRSGSLIFSEEFTFPQESFIYYEVGEKWVCVRRIPGERFFSSITSGVKSVTAFPHIIKSINSGYAVLKVNLANGRRVLSSTTTLERLLDIDRLVCFYFRNDVAPLQAELNRQWPFKARIRGYFKMGNYCWMLVERAGNEIIISPQKIYKQYILQSTDGGHGWNIAWKSDDPYYFYIEIFNMETFSKVRISTPYATFVTEDEGKTWYNY